MINAFQSIITQEDNFEDYLTKALLFKIFEPIFITYQDAETAKKIVKFIAYAYSMESTKITVGGDRRKEKEHIFHELFYENATKVSPTLYAEVILLKEEAIVKAAQKWMEFQDNTQLEYLLTLKEAYIQHQHASLAPLKKADGIATDFDQKYKCIEYMRDIKKMIKDAESELNQSSNKLKDAFEEVKRSNKKNTMGAGEAVSL